MIRSSILIVVLTLGFFSLKASADSFLPQVNQIQSSTQDFRSRLHTKLVDAPYTQDDIETEIVFGRELASKILAKIPPLKSDERNLYVNKVGKSVAEYSGRSELDYHFIILDTDSINAFAAPGGYVFITKGALDNMQDEAELAAVIGHEMGHIEYRHYVKKVNLRSAKGDGESALMEVISGGGRAASQAFNEALDQMMEVLFETGLQSKKDEYEADQASVYLLANSGYDPAALRRYFTRISKIESQQVEGLSNTHPPIHDRIEELRTLLYQNDFSNINLPRLQDRFNENR